MVSLLSGATSLVQGLVELPSRVAAYAHDTNERVQVALARSIRDHYRTMHPYLTAEELDQIVETRNAEPIVQRAQFRLASKLSVVRSWYERKFPDLDKQTIEKKLERIVRNRQVEEYVQKAYLDGVALPDEQRLEGDYACQEEMREDWEDLYESGGPWSCLTGIVVPERNMQERMIQETVRSQIGALTGYQIERKELEGERDLVVVEAPREEEAPVVGEALFMGMLAKVNKVMMVNKSFKALWEKKEYAEALWKLLYSFIHAILKAILPKSHLHHIYHSFIDHTLDKERQVLVVGRFVETLHQRRGEYTELADAEKEWKALLNNPLLTSDQTKRCNELRWVLLNNSSKHIRTVDQTDERLKKLKTMVRSSQYWKTNLRMQHLLVLNEFLTGRYCKDALEYFHAYLDQVLYPLLDFPEAGREAMKKNLSLDLFVSIVEAMFQNDLGGLDEERFNDQALDLISDLGAPIFAQGFQGVVREELEDLRIAPPQDGNDVLAVEEYLAVEDTQDILTSGLASFLGSQKTFEYAVRGRVPEDAPYLLRAAISVYDPFTHERKKILPVAEYIRMTADATRLAMQSVARQAVVEDDDSDYVWLESAQGNVPPRGNVVRTAPIGS